MPKFHVPDCLGAPRFWVADIARNGFALERIEYSDCKQKSEISCRNRRQENRNSIRQWAIDALAGLAGLAGMLQAHLAKVCQIDREKRGIMKEPTDPALPAGLGKDDDQSDNRGSREDRKKRKRANPCPDAHEQLDVPAPQATDGKLSEHEHEAGQ